MQQIEKKISKVYWPGDKSLKTYKIAKKQMNGFGGILSVDINGNLNNTMKFLENIDMFTLAESLGGVESLIEHPAIMTHASIDKPIREELGISDTLVRLSIGIEHPDDIISDIKQALAA